MKSFSQRTNRRGFLKATGLGMPLLFVKPAKVLADEPRFNPAWDRTAREWKADLVIVGGGLGGCSAALAAARNGLKVIMTEETDWIGGQLTQQAVPPDENPWIETFGATRSYQDLRNRIRAYYQRNYPLTEAARKKKLLNPGNGDVSRLCHEPRVSLAVLREMLAPFIASARLILFTRHRVIAASVDHDRVEAIQVRNEGEGGRLNLVAPFFIDATETGELLPITGTEHVSGAESKAQTGELHAASEPQPHNMQAFTCCFAMDYVPEEDHTIERPDEYSFWREFVPPVSPEWPGRLLNFSCSDNRTLKTRNLGFDPANAKGWFRYRRIIDHANFLPGVFAGDITLVNWPQNDYLGGNLFGDTPEAAARHLARAKELSLSLLYWLQTEAPRPDGGTGWKGLRLRPDVVGTKDGLAKYPYVRESRRIQAEFTVLEQHVGTSVRMTETGLSREEVTAAEFGDSVGIGSYRIDLHPSTGGDNYIDISSLPFQIPLGALIPRRMKNLLPACKNLGVTHISNGCYRLHPVEWNIGEAAGMLAQFCVSDGKMPRQVRADEKDLAEFQGRLSKDGIPLRWEGKVGPR